MGSYMQPYWHLFSELLGWEEGLQFYFMFYSHLDHGCQVWGKFGPGVWADVPWLQEDICSGHPIYVWFVWYFTVYQLVCNVCPRWSIVIHLQVAFEPC